MSWPRIRELLWRLLDTESRIRIVVAQKDSQLQNGLIFGTSATLYMLGILQEYEKVRPNYESILWYLQTPSSDTSGCSDSESN